MFQKLIIEACALNNFLCYYTKKPCLHENQSKERICEGTSLVKILQSCHFNIFEINHRCLRKLPIKKNNEQPKIVEKFIFSLAVNLYFFNFSFFFLQMHEKGLTDFLDYNIYLTRGWDKGVVSMFYISLPLFCIGSVF